MNTALIVLLVLLVLLLMIGVPVGFAIGGATMVAMFYCSDLNMVVNAQYCYSGIFSFTVMAIPFFMLAGSVISTGGIAKRIVEFASPEPWAAYPCWRVCFSAPCPAPAWPPPPPSAA